jgi:hypothetical protein
MSGARYEGSAHRSRTAHWPFALPDPAQALPWIAPEFRSNLDRILSTSRYYLQIEAGERRQRGRVRRSRRG